MMTYFLAEAASTDTMVSGDWMLKLIGALFTGAALVLGRYWGRKEAQETKIADPVPEVPTRKVMTPPTWDAHKALCDRVTALEHVTQELRRDMAGQYRELMMAGAAREANISDKLDGIARSIHARIDDLMKPKTGR